MTGALPALLADIGGTNARFALLEGGTVTDIRTIPTGQHRGLAEAARTYLDGRAAATAAIAVAGPVTRDEISLTNQTWSFTRRGLSQDLKLDALHVINDFTAQALALPHLGADDLRPVGPLSDAPAGPKAVLGPGTGLGVSGLIPTPGGWRAMTTEGGHVTLPARTKIEDAVIAWLRARHDHVSAERALSGPGLSELMDAVSEIEGHPAERRDPADITDAAANGEPLAARAVALFCDFLGTVAADLTLNYGATGGVYIAGGIVPKLGDLFMKSGFRSRFEDKGRFADYLRAVPAFVVTTEYPALTGLKALLDGTSAPEA